MGDLNERAMRFVAELPPGELDKLDSLREWAVKPENHWLRRHADRPPGERSDRVRGLIVIEGEPREQHVYTVVFTITESVNAGLVRHVSIGCDAGRHEPSPKVAAVVMQRLGFLGTLDTCQVSQHPRLPRVYEILEAFTVQ